MPPVKWVIPGIGIDMETPEELKVGDLVRCFYTKEHGVVMRVDLKRTHTEVWVLWSRTGKTTRQDDENIVKVKTETALENIK